MKDMKDKMRKVLRLVFTYLAVMAVLIAIDLALGYPVFTTENKPFVVHTLSWFFAGCFLGDLFPIVNTSRSD